MAALLVVVALGGVVMLSGGDRESSYASDDGQVAAVGGDGSDDTDTPDDSLVAALAERPPPPTSPPPPDGYSTEQLGEVFGDAVWRVDVNGCGVEGGGSAFAVTPHHLVTNWHVTAADAEPTVVSRSGEQRQGRVVGMVEDPDVAVIVVDEPMPLWVDWAPTDELTEGQALTAIGYPRPAQAFTVTALSVASFEQEGEERTGIRGDGRIDRGNSGGPAFTADGRVAGITTAVNINPGGETAGIFGGGLQVVPLIQTHSAVDGEVEGFLESTETVEADCAVYDPDQAETYGDNPLLDELWDWCDEGDPFACDELYKESRLGSEYQLFGRTCGGRLPEGSGYCANRNRGLPLPPN